MVQPKDEKSRFQSRRENVSEGIRNKARKEDKGVKKLITTDVDETSESVVAPELEIAPIEKVIVQPIVGAPGEATQEYIEKVISINRITKVTKGGKKLSFSALVVVGDSKGHVGYSLSKAKEVSIAIRKALVSAKRNMVKIPMKGSTITHEIIGECGGASVLLKPASEGTGVIASGPVRAVCDGAGIRNILTKCHRSNNPINVVKATMDGLLRLKPVQNQQPKQEFSHASA